jgi:hypothetical protein
MSKQIRIAQSGRDEREFVDWVTEGWALLSLPRLMEGQPVDPVPLGECKSRQQLIFPLEMLQTVVQSIVPLLGDKSRCHVSPAVSSGSCIEWCRTVEESPGRFVVGGAAESRFFLGTFNSEPSSRSLAQLMTQILKFVSRNYPTMTTDSPRRFIGPDLSSRLSTGEARLFYPNGLPVVHGPNHACTSVPDGMSRPNNGAGL